jgi:hypothetical protein
MKLEFLNKHQTRSNFMKKLLVGGGAGLTVLLALSREISGEEFPSEQKALLFFVLIIALLIIVFMSKKDEEVK